MGHTGVILLVKANDKKEARKEARKFLSDYGDGRIYDYYTIGGAWSGILSGYEPRDNPKNREMCCHCFGSGKDTRAGDQKCCGCSGTGRALKHSGYWVRHEGDVLPLPQVKDKVAEFLGNWREGLLKLANEGIAESEKDGSELSLGAFCILKGSVIWDEFIWDSRVYDVELRSNNLPESADGYWAVVVDMHG